MPPMFSSTPPSCVSLIYLSFDLRVSTPLKLRHPRNMLSVSGLITVHRVSSLLATANISLFLSGWLTFSTLTSTCLDINVILLPLLFYVSPLPAPFCLAIDSPIFLWPALHLRLSNLLPSPLLLPYLPPDRPHLPCLRHNPSILRNLRLLVHNTPLHLPLVRLPNTWQRQRPFKQPLWIYFFFWMLHGSTKVVVRAVAPLSANINHKVAMSLGK